MRKPALPDHPIHDLIAERWSPYWFDDREVSERDLLSILEAARWAASSYNEQPWTYLLARRRDADAFTKMVACLVEGNQAWAANASVLMLGLTRLARNLDGAPNPAAAHDLGLAAATLTFEATSRGIFVHQMSGIVPERICAEYAVPDSHVPVTALALGYCATTETVPERYRERQQKPRSRQRLSDFVFEGSWNNAARIVR